MKKIALYILLTSNIVQPVLLNAHPSEAAQEITKKSSALESNGYDELDAIYLEQGDTDEAMISHAQMPEWVVSLGLAVILKYLALKDFMTTSWEKIKQTIARK